MKKLNISILFAAVMGLFTLAGCDKGELGPVANTGTPGAPAITAPAQGASFTLSREVPDTTTVVTIEWSEPDFGFPAAPSYTVQLGISGNDFADAENLGTVQRTSFSVAVGDLNRMLLAKELPGGEPSSLQLRVIASISDSVSAAVSAPVTIQVTPFLTTFPPIFMIGSAVGGWNLDLARIVPSTEPNVYSTLAVFTNGGAFRFFGQQNWGPDSWNYPYFADGGGTIDPLLANANDGDSNFQFTGTTGWYRITVNMETLNIDMTEAEEPLMFMTGLATGAWDKPGTGESVKMIYIQDGVFEATAEFSSAGDANFRFFPQPDWAPVSYNYPYFADNGGVIDELLINAGDGDSNFAFTGTDGTYYIKVDINNYTVEMEAQ